MKKSTRYAITVLLLLSGAAFAGLAENFAKYDANKDGVMQKTEYITMRTAWKKDAAESEKFFINKDKNKDGVLSKAEFGIK